MNTVMTDAAATDAPGPGATLPNTATDPLTIRLPDTVATNALGAALARSFPVAERKGAVAYLQGELGAGKSTCVRSLLRAFGVTGLIRSPTYTLVEVYETKALTCVHLDLYRLRSPLEVAELDLRQYAQAGCLMLIEWPEQGAGELPSADLRVEIAYEADARAATLRAGGDSGSRWLHNLGKDTSFKRYVSHMT